MHTEEKEKNINLGFNEKFPESARTWELRDKALICLPCFIYGLVLKKENALTFHTMKSSHMGEKK